jgi:hypothetical protein
MNAGLSEETTHEFSDQVFDFTAKLIPTLGVSFPQLSMQSVLPILASQVD